MNDPRLHRIDSTRVRIDNPHGIEATLFAGEDVPVETAAVDELSTMLDLDDTARAFASHSPECFDQEPEVLRVAVTPDFHKARGIPVGTVLATRGFSVPQAIGNDINCGMRLHVTSLKPEQITSRLDDLETAFRHIYFEGGRNIPMSRMQRESLLTKGLDGLFDATPRSSVEGLWSIVHELDMAAELERIDRRGSLAAGPATALNDWLGPADRVSRDSQIGSIGGGNHFVEIQRVERIIDGTIAHAWGLKQGAVTIMVHTGSVSLGHASGTRGRDAVRAAHPASLPHPGNGIFILPHGPRHREAAARVHDALNHAANFAFANRMFLAVMAVAGLRRVFGHVDASLLYDAPHNFLWREEIDGEEVTIHRKGACPARGYDAMEGTPFAYTGEPVLVPGSMGASSFILAGRGLAEGLSSASHGAGPDALPRRGAEGARGGIRGVHATISRSYADRSAAARRSQPPRHPGAEAGRDPPGGPLRLQGHRAGREDSHGGRSCLTGGRACAADDHQRLTANQSGQYGFWSSPIVAEMIRGVEVKPSPDAFLPGDPADLPAAKRG